MMLFQALRWPRQSAEKDRPGERGAPPGHKEGKRRLFRMPLLLLGDKAEQTFKEGNLSFAEAIIEVALEKHMYRTWSYCELESC